MLVHCPAAGPAGARLHRASSSDQPSTRRGDGAPMCGIAGIVQLRGTPSPRLRSDVEVMNRLLAHRGPDDSGVWVSPDGRVALGHRRLSIIDPTPAGHQPFVGEDGAVVT